MGVCSSQQDFIASNYKSPSVVWQNGVGHYTIATVPPNSSYSVSVLGQPKKHYIFTNAPHLDLKIVGILTQKDKIELEPGANYNPDQVTLEK